jgi:hypothetical protein
MKYIKTSQTCIEYRGLDGNTYVPTGERTTGGARIMLGDQELLKQNIALITYDHTRKTKYPLQSEIVEVFKIGKVIYHLKMTWQEMDDLRKELDDEKDILKHEEIIMRFWNK